MSHFKDRVEAGQHLAEDLKDYQDQPKTLVLALPRGGVPVAHAMATKLHLPLNIFLVRKLGVPGHEELALGAIAEENICVLNEDLIHQLRITNAQIQRVINREKQELGRRLQQYRQGKALPHLKETTIILVDDGVATGATIKAAIDALKSLQAKNIIVAVPVASQESLTKLRALVDQVICPLTPEPFYGVGRWYQSFPQTSDEEVIHLLEDVQKHVNEHWTRL